jgi:hypothetical protein
MRARGPRKERGTGGWIHTAKLAFFVALGFVRFVGESTSLQPPVSPEGDDVASRWARELKSTLPNQ